jgi:hypothetical protein
MRTMQFTLTVAAGKRLIGKGAAAHPKLAAALAKGRCVIVAGSTNGYVAEEVLRSIGQLDDFTREGFCRGVVAPPGSPGMSEGKLRGDVIITDGQWRKEDRSKTVFDVIADLGSGDVVFKGGNAVDLARRRAGVLIGHPQAGTIGAIIPAVYGRRVQLVVPIGLEKRVADDIDSLAAEINSPRTEGPRLLPLPGEVFTEIDAISLLTGASARLAAAGGIRGAEGASWLAISGDDGQLRAAEKLIRSVADEPPTRI